MKLTNDEIYLLYSALQSLKNEKIALPIKDGFVLVKNMKILQPLVEAIEETRETIIKKYVDESGVICAEKRAAVNKELYELSKVENDVILNKLSLTKIENLNLDLNIISALAPIIEEDGD